MIRALFGEVCHQLPARTLVVAGVLLPACARCAGFYLGVALTSLFYLVAGRGRLFLRYPGRRGVAFAAAAVAPWGVDTVLARVGSPLALGNGGRFVVSLLAGWGGWVLLAAAATLLRWRRRAGRRLGSATLGGSLVPLLLAAALTAMPHPAAAAVLTFGILAGALAFYALLNYLPLTLFLRGRRVGAVARGIILTTLAALALGEMRWGYVIYGGWASFLRRVFNI